MKNTTLCYIEQDDSYLMLHRVKKHQDPNAGKWIGVGGKFENGESPDECLVRVVREETGLTLTHWRCRGVVTFVSDEWPTEYMHLFTADDFEGRLTDCNEGELAWIFLELLAREEPFFLLKLSYQGDRLAGAVLNGQALEL